MHLLAMRDITARDVSISVPAKIIPLVTQQMGSAVVLQGGMERHVTCLARLDSLVITAQKCVNVKTGQPAVPTLELATAAQDGQEFIAMKDAQKIHSAVSAMRDVTVKTVDHVIMLMALVSAKPGGPDHSARTPVIRGTTGTVVQRNVNVKMGENATQLQDSVPA